MIEKSANAYRTISETASIVGVPQHVLRFWETKFSHIRPMKQAGGRRYYRTRDIQLLCYIKKLLYEDGYTIAGAQKYLRRNNAAIPEAIEKPGSGKTETAIKAESLNREHLQALYNKLAVLRAGLAQAGETAKNISETKPSPLPQEEKKE